MVSIWFAKEWRSLVRVMNNKVDELVELNHAVSVAVELRKELLQVPAVAANLKFNEHSLQLVSRESSVAICVKLFEDGSQDILV